MTYFDVVVVWPK